MCNETKQTKQIILHDLSQKYKSCLILSNQKKIGLYQKSQMKKNNCSDFYLLLSNTQKHVKWPLVSKHWPKMTIIPHYLAFFDFWQVVQYVI